MPTVRNQVLFVFLLLAHDRRRVIHFNVTANPRAAWTAQQIVEAFPWQDPPKYLLRDRDKIYGPRFRKRVVGTIRRECLDHVIVINEKHLKRTLGSYLRYYHGWRTHRSLEMDSPEPREVHSADRGKGIDVPEVGGLHHHYERIAA